MTLRQLLLLTLELGATATLIGVSLRTFAWGNALERRYGDLPPRLAGIGALSAALLLLLGGWRVLAEMAHVITAHLGSVLLGSSGWSLLLIGYVIWLGLSLGMWIGAQRVSRSSPTLANRHRHM